MMHRLFRTALSATLVAAALMSPQATKAQLNVVTSTTDLYDIAREVGGSRIKATHIGEGYQDPHFVEAKPSFVLQLRKADVFALVGLDLEIGWAPLLIDGARNPKIRPGGSGYVDVSKSIPVLDAARGSVDRSGGDVHPLGNPHYWLDPENGRRIARLFHDKFVQLDPAGRATYDQGLAQFVAKLAAAEKQWAPLVAQIKGKPVVAWHTSWRYFQEYNGMNIVAFMEPKPGIPPSPSHLLSVIRAIKASGAKVILKEPWYDRKTAELVAKQTGAKVVELPPSVGGVKGMDDYLQLIGNDLKLLADAVR